MKLYLRYLSIHIKGILQYKMSFFLSSLGQFLVSFTALLSIYFMFSRFREVEGFTLNEVLLCFSVVLIAFSVAECLVRGFDTFPRMISNGEFDRVLVRPRGVIFQVLASKLELSRWGRFLQAVIVLIYAMGTCRIAWTPGKLCILAAMILCGALTFSGLFLLYAAFSFFTLEGLEFMNIFTDGGREFGQYPLAIYGKGVLKFLTFVIPMACYQYYPFLYLIGRTENPASLLSMGNCVLFLLPCSLFWRFGIRHYRSTGS